MARGEINQKPNSRGGARTKMRGCLKFESEVVKRERATLTDVIARRLSSI
jgi:hypothetical protein